MFHCLKVRNGDEESEPSLGQDREPGEHIYGEAVVERELAYGFLCDRKEGGQKKKSKAEQKDECVKVNPPLEVVPKWLSAWLRLERRGWFLVFVNPTRARYICDVCPVELHV